MKTATNSNFALARISGRSAELTRALATDTIRARMKDLDAFQQTMEDVGRQLADALHGEVPHADPGTRRLLLAARRAAHGGRPVAVRDLESLVCHDETRHLLHAYDWAHGALLVCHQSLLDQFNAQWHGEHQILERAAREDEFQIGVFWSSPDFFKQLNDQLARGALSQSPSMTQAVLRYATRFTSKPTPFSRFARVVPVQFDLEKSHPQAEHTGVRLVGAYDPVNRVYLNRGLFEVFWRIIVGDPGLREHLAFRLNTSALMFDQSLLLVSCEGGRERLVNVQMTPVLKELTELAAEAAVPFSYLRAAVVRTFKEASREIVDQYLDHLIKMNLLIADAPVAANDPRWHEALCTWLNIGHFAGSAKLRQTLDLVNSALPVLSTAALEEKPRILSSIEQAVRTCLLERNQAIHLPHGMLAYEDCSSTAVLSIQMNDEMQEVLETLRACARVTLSVAPALDEQERLREFFRQEFAGESTVSLMIFADRVFRSHFSRYLAAEQDLAKGASADELKELQQRFDSASIKARSAARRQLAEYLLRKLQSSGEARSCDISLGELHGITAELGRSGDVDSTSIAVQFAQIEGRLFGVAQGFGLAGGNGKMASRFLDLLPARHTTELKGFNTSRVGPISAELVHDVDFNANLHPALTEAEIVYPTRVGRAVTPNQFLTRDLLVGPDREDDSVLVLYHKDRTQRVRPLDLGFLNPIMRQPFFRLLSRFQPPSAGSLPIETTLLEYHRWKAGGAQTVTCSPRLTAGNRLVLARARWRVPIAMSPEQGRSESMLGYMMRIERWRMEWDIPPRVFVRAFIPPTEQQRLPAAVRRRAYRDQKPQLIDFGSIHLTGLFGRLGRLSDHTILLLEEVLPDQEDYLQTEQGRFAYELFLQMDGIHVE